MITRIEDGTPTNRSWNGRDDIHQHYIGHFPVSEHLLTLSLAWKKEEHSPIFDIGRFRFDMPRLVDAGFARVHDGEYIIRFQRTDRRIEVAINRTSPAVQLAPLPDTYFQQ